jgi:hypothetical protein
MWTEEKLNELLTTPSEPLVDDIRRLEGDILVLGAGGKMGPTLCLLAQNAINKAGINKKIIAVSRFSDPSAVNMLHENGVETIAADFSDIEKLNSLPQAKNVIYMAGRKFDTLGKEPFTWGMNATLPAFVAYKHREANIVVFSSGNIYPMVSVNSGGCTEEDAPAPVGEYAMSCLARERAFEYAAMQYSTKVFLYRLNYAVDLRYGVLYDIAKKIINDEPIPVNTPCFNCIWQGSANRIAISGLLYADSPAVKMNVTGPETISVRYAAQKLGESFGKQPVFEGEEQKDAYLNNASKSISIFGYPQVCLETLLKWQAEWILDGGRALDKPTHFEERKGKF